MTKIIRNIEVMGPKSFLELNDTPSTYEGSQYRMVAVDADEDRLIFVDNERLPNAIGSWRFMAADLTPPLTGQFTTNNLDPSMVTNIYYNQEDSGGTDKSPQLDYFIIGDDIYTGGDTTTRYQIITISINGDVYEYGVSLRETSGLYTIGLEYELAGPIFVPGAGDVSSAGPSVGDNLAAFVGTTGKLIQDGGVSISDVEANNTHRASDGKNHSDVVLNNTHRGSDGTDHSNVVLNDAHRATITGNPHEVTQSDVGLSDVDNTSDLDKPTSSDTSFALNNTYLSTGVGSDARQDLRDKAGKYEPNHAERVAEGLYRNGLWSKASLVLVPGGYSTGVLYGLRRRDATSDFVFSGDVGHTSRINEYGKAETVAADTPRLNYSRYPTLSPSILLEGTEVCFVPDLVTNNILSGDRGCIVEEISTGRYAYNYTSDGNYTTWHNGVQGATQAGTPPTSYSLRNPEETWEMVMFLDPLTNDELLEVTNVGYPTYAMMADELNYNIK